MTLETVYILRHGFRLNWVTTRWKSETGLPRDPRCRVQAKEVADYFQSLPEDQRPTAIFSSPYYRCLQTAKPTAVALGLPIYVEHGIAEWYYPVEPGTGLHPRPSSASALKAYFSEIDDSWSSVWYPTRKGEDLNALLDRLTGFVSVFVPEIHRRFTGAAAHKRILFVGHAATVIGLTQAWVGDRNLSFRAACCSLTVLDRKAVVARAPSRESAVVGGAGGDWTPRILGGGDHLKDGLLRDWGFEDVRMADGEEHGVPGTENEKDEPVSSQVVELTSRM
ncbi:histidine phosphatase superfamily [Lactifluus volemus]|nr:histidine phosphatase superfamily [Lactifluus volemus]